MFHAINSVQVVTSYGNSLSADSSLKERYDCEDEVDLQELFENFQFSEPLDPEAFTNDRGWWFRCRLCDRSTRVSTRIPSCRYCTFKQTKKGDLE